jgi:hypothetical protein
MDKFHQVLNSEKSHSWKKDGRRRKLAGNKRRRNKNKKKSRVVSCIKEDQLKSVPIKTCSDSDKLLGNTETN